MELYILAIMAPESRNQKKYPASSLGREIGQQIGRVSFPLC